MPAVRRLYLYLAALIGLLALLTGLIGGSSALLGALLSGGPWPGSWAALAQSALGRWAALVVISAPLWAGHWFLANRAASQGPAGAAKRGAPARKAYFYVGQLGALLALLWQAGVLLDDLAIQVVPGAPIAGATMPGWPAGLLSSLAGCVFALAFLSHLRRSAYRDGDVGHEAGAGASWRRLYDYAAALIGTALAAGGTAGVLSYALGFAAQALPGGTPAAKAGQDAIAVFLPPAASLAAFVLGVPLVLTAWRRIDRHTAGDASGAEANWPGRKLLLYAGLLAGVAVTVLSATFLIVAVGHALQLDQGLQVIRFGLATTDAGAPWAALLASAFARFLAFFPVGCVLWRWYGCAVRGDLAWAPETSGAATLRRLYFYLAAAITLAAAWYGAQQLLAVAILAALGGAAGGSLASALAVPAPGVREALLGAALLIPAGPAWWWHWRLAENWARQPGPAGHEERASATRKIYLHGVGIGVAVVVVVDAATVIYHAPGGPFGLQAAAGLPGPDFLSALAGLGAAVLLALCWWIGHALVLRQDARLLAGAAAGYGVPPSSWEPVTTPAADGGGAEAAGGGPGPGGASEPPVAAGPAQVAAPVPEGGAVKVDAGSGGPRRIGAPAIDEAAAGAVGNGQARGVGHVAAAAALPVAAKAASRSPAPSRQHRFPEPCMAVAVIDGGDGELGALLLSALQQALPGTTLWPIGLNPGAQEAMDQALVTRPAGAIPADAVARAKAIVGPGEIVVPGGLAGEMPPELAAAVAASPAHKVLLPVAGPGRRTAGGPDRGAPSGSQEGSVLAGSEHQPPARAASPDRPLSGPGALHGPSLQHVVAEVGEILRREQPRVAG
jgi:hypothetical protein